jgi:acid phosphatase
LHHLRGSPFWRTGGAQGDPFRKDCARRATWEFVMRAPKRSIHWSALLAPLLAGCGPGGVEGSSGVADLPIEGTIFTIVFENHGEGVVSDEMPYVQSLADGYASADAYYADHHPSLPNYLIMTSGSDHDVSDDDDPGGHPLGGTDNLADQLDAADIPWRAYMEDMGEPCLLVDRGLYAVRHNPFAYYTSLTSDAERCGERIVDMASHFEADLAAGEHDYMWITPNDCNNMHDCSPATADAWLAQVIPAIMDSPGYQAGGAIFILWDEGGPDATWVFGGKQSIPFILVSDHVVSPGFVSNIRYSHDSYLATIEDAFGMPRLPTTIDSTPMADFFGAPQAAPPSL